jgi:hypothetical protein
VNDLPFYAAPGTMTDPGLYATALDALPTDLDALCGIVQGVLIHPFWTDSYGLSVPEERRFELELRALSQKLPRIFELDARPLGEARPPERRLLGNCRDHTVLLCSFLRHQGVPARARCGFATYFQKDRFVDHWIAEVWDDREGRWQQVDPQLDGLQGTALGIDFDPTDLPDGAFLTGGTAWERCRAGAADPQRFGILDMHGWWFIQGNVVRDLLALAKIEVLPWDICAAMRASDDALIAEDRTRTDALAALVSRRETPRIDDLLALIRESPDLQPPVGVGSLAKPKDS